MCAGSDRGKVDELVSGSGMAGGGHGGVVKWNKMGD